MIPIPIPVHTLELKGGSYEVGRKLGGLISENEAYKAAYIRPLEGFGLPEYKGAVRLLDEWCPGIPEEIAGFADALQVKPEQIAYYAMTYLVPRCSQIAVLPGMTAQNTPMLARNYEFHHQIEDFVLARTSIPGKYTHMGTTTMSFGRDDGFNEHGLVVTMSACGHPVGAVSFLRSPQVKGIQFWAAIRALLEHCKDVEEALAYVKEMPISSNVNLMLVDRGGHAALFETMDGRQETRRLYPDSPERSLWATNHPVLPSLIRYEPQAAEHSLQRGAWIVSQLKQASALTGHDLKKMLLAPYPEGLCCHYYEDYFGTTKSMVFSPAEGTVELCWGGRAENGWHTYDIGQPLPSSTATAEITLENADPAMFKRLPL